MRFPPAAGSSTRIASKRVARHRAGGRAALADRRLGRGLIKAEADACASKGDCSEEVSCELVISGGDSPEVLEFVEETLDEVALAVEVRIDRAANPYVALGRDVGLGAARLDDLDDGAGRVSTVGNHVPRQSEAVEQLRSGGLVGCLAGGEHEADRQAALIDDDMDFGAQSSTRTANGVIRTPFFPPAACWCARTIEESIR